MTPTVVSSATSELRELVYPEEGQGLYDVAQFEEEHLLTLRRKEPLAAAFREIRVQNVPTEAEQWRMFLGGHVDMVQHISRSHQRYLKQDPSVRVVPFQRRQMASLIFRTTAPTVADARTRRAISLALRRRAIGEMVSGDPASAATMPEDLVEARRLLGELGVGEANPLRIVVWVPTEASEFLNAALIVEQQLALVNVDVEFHPLGAAEIQQRFEKAQLDFDGFIFFGSVERRRWGHVEFLSQYKSPELDAAAQDDDLWRALMHKDVPATPLYYVEEAVVVNVGLCGVRPISPASPLWLADVHPCRSGETE